MEMPFDYKQGKHYYFIPVTYPVQSLYGTEILIKVVIIPGTALAFLEL